MKYWHNALQERSRAWPEQRVPTESSPDFETGDRQQHSFKGRIT